MLDRSTLEAVSLLLREAEELRRPIAPLSITHSDIDTDDAYAVQLITIDVRLSSGAVIKGHKIGLTSRAMQDQLGVTEPDYGHLLDAMFVFEGGDVACDELCAPRVEVEIAFVLKDGLSGPGVTAADVLRSTAFVVPAIEIIDSRISDWKIQLVDTIADNASSAKVVLGGRGVGPLDLDLRTIGATLSRNGRIVDSGSSGAVLGNPVTAVAWLANKLSEFGSELQSGHVIMAGSCTRAIAVGAGDSIRADFDHLGNVEVNFV